MKIYTADFGAYGSVVVVAPNLDEAMWKMRDAHPTAAEFFIERFAAEVTEHLIDSDFVFAPRGAG